ncbi:SafA/ExsA family spore coat assembly protein [Jeotgalibacillus campisalis]|uniref:LysM domain-containing protein n=1 Tax=Jeotgalibacillus campisalis TaxID=220754 RepID=A0A0C2VB18_9BACL|nr:SafA/ExsA family spore coat assembly protein [Jeotgalibacillus campisalis]KIL46122.1 hypothetical protein KR50_27970 [Jeotgalibacillus campisalis]
MKIHVVQKGDTLWNIAKKYNVSFEELKAANTQLSNPDMIMPGMKIKVPSNSKAKKEVVVKETVVKESVVEHPYMDQKPKMQYQPMPMPIPQQKPIMMQPEIDIHQTYNLQLHQSQPHYKQQQPMPMPMPMPHIPAPELPKAPSPKKEVKKEVKNEMKEKPAVKGTQEGMMPQMPEDCHPVTPVMPGDGFDYPFPHPMGMPQVQGTQMMPHPHHEMHQDHAMMHHPQVQGAQMMPPPPQDCMEMSQWNPQQTAGAGQHMKKPCGCGNNMNHHPMHQMNQWGQPMPYGNHPHMGYGPGPGMNQPFMGMGNMPQMGQPDQGMSGSQDMMNWQGMPMMNGQGMPMMNGQGMPMMNGQGMPGMMSGQGMDPTMMNQGPGMMSGQGFEPYGMPGMMQPMPRFYEEQDE